MDQVQAPSLAANVLAGDPRAVARAISLVENELPAGEALIGELFQRTGRAYILGVTGPPGAGKSTLVDRLTVDARSRGERVGIIAVDPSSPFTGGALLGDRVRMQTHASDDGVFIRSMATRGHLGGLARATGDAILVLDAAGYDLVMVETVGVGQDEVEIVQAADVAIVVLVPGAGDEVQALKAGIMEIADIFVVNKADREGADRLAAEIESMLSLRPSVAGEWRPPVIKTEATKGTGIPDLVDGVARWRATATPTRHERRLARVEAWLREILGRRFVDTIARTVGTRELAEIVEAVAARRVNPYQAAADLFERGMRREEPERR